MGNTPYTGKKRKKALQKKARHIFKNPYKEGWLWKQSRHLKKWRKRWIVVHSHYIYTFPSKRMHESPTEIIDLRNFTCLSKETTFEEPKQNIAQATFANIKKKLSNSLNGDGYAYDNIQSEQKYIEQRPIYVLLLSDLNNDETFMFKCDSITHQSQWIYSLERALEYKSNLIQNVIGSEIIKYIVSLYFLSYERLSLSTISHYFNQLFSYKNYNCQYHYSGDAIFWNAHFRKFTHWNTPKKSKRKKKTIEMNKFSALSYEESKESFLSVEEMQFNEASFHLSNNDWSKLQKNERLQMKYFFIFYHEFSALNYKKRQSELSTYYIRSRARNRSYRSASQKKIKSRKSRKRNLKKARKRNVRDRSRKYSDEDSGLDSDVSSVCDGDNEQICEEIIEELSALDLKYENIRIDGYEWTDFMDEWAMDMSAAFVTCNIQTICIGASNFYDESASMMTQLVNNAIDLRVGKNANKHRQNRYYKSTFWENGGCQWLGDVLKYSRALSTHLSTIRVLSLRDSNLCDKHLKYLCNAINAKVYESSKSLTIRKLILSNNPDVTDNVMKLLFMTVGNKLQYLEELELNDCGLTDRVSQIMYEFYFNFHFNYDKTQLYSVSLLGNSFTVKGFQIMNKLFENEIIDEDKFMDGNRKVFHIGVNARKKADVRNCTFDPRLHIVVSNIMTRI